MDYIKSSYYYRVLRGTKWQLATYKRRKYKKGQDLLETHGGEFYFIQFNTINFDH